MTQGYLSRHILGAAAGALLLVVAAPGPAVAQPFGHGTSGELSARIQPASWNVNWPVSSGQLSAMLQGPISGLVPESVVLVGENGELANHRVDHAGNHFRAFFPKSQALDILVDPLPGTIHEIVVRFEHDGGVVEIQVDVRVVPADDGEDEGEDDGEDDECGGGGQAVGTAGDFMVALQPGVWNLNWSHSAGQVSAKIHGPVTGLMWESVTLVGEAGELANHRVQRAGNHFRAFFRKAGAIDTLGDAERCTTEEVIVRFEHDGGTIVEVPVTIQVVGPAADDGGGDDGGGDGGGGEGEDDGGELGVGTADGFLVKVRPHTWNLRWVGSRGQLSAKMQGPFDGLLWDSVTLVGPEGELANHKVKRGGNHFRAFFRKAEAHGILLDPQPGTTHEIVVRFEHDGGVVEVPVMIRVVGPAS